MNIINDQVYSVNLGISSTPLSDENPTVRMNEEHLHRLISDMEIIRENDKEAISQLAGVYQENSDGTFHSYSTEEMNVDGTNKVKVYVEAEYSSGNISGYTIHYTEFDLAGNILASTESKLDADGTTIDLPNDDPTVGLNKSEGEVVPQVVTNPPEGEVAPQTVTDPAAGKEALLTESINSFPLYGEEVASVLIASTIMEGAALASIIICMA